MTAGEHPPEYDSGKILAEATTPEEIEQHRRELEKATRRAAPTAIALDLSEDQLALGFCTAHPGLRHVQSWGRWMRWTGTVWAEDRTAYVYDKIREHIRATVTGPSTAKWLRAPVVAGVERMSKTDRRYAMEDDIWDTDDWVLNTPDGTVNLKTAAVHDNVQGDYLTKITGNGIGPGDCPEWLTFLKQVTGGDQYYVDFLQRVVGYAATGSTREHALFFLYGNGGNGKGTFLNTIQKIMGDYAVVASMETFTESRSERHPTDLAMLRGARLVLAQETEEGRAWAEPRIKALTGGDPISARYMRQDFFTYLPKFKLLIAGNHKPRLKNVDEAMRRRLHLLPFVHEFIGNACDPDLGDKLMVEAEAILGWIVDGAAAYQAEGLNPPGVVTDATAAYFASEDLFGQWLDECCELGASEWHPSQRLFQSWSDFATGAGEPHVTRTSFAERMQHCFGDTVVRRYLGSQKRCHLGVSLVIKPVPEAWK
jgi:P4 family phage/plasmid primase-like protien